MFLVADKVNMRNRNVVGITHLFMLWLLLSACTKASAPQVNFLSLSLPVLKTTIPSPFDQDIEATGHIVLGGSCFSIVNSFEMQFDDLPWVALPTTAPTAQAGETAPVDGGGNPLVYDQDCSNGDFHFWVYAHQLDAALASLGIAQTVGEYDPAVIRLRGRGQSMTTEPLVFNSPHGNNGGGGGVATKIALDHADQHPGAALAGSCTQLRVSVQDASNRWTNPTGTVTFELRIAGAVRSFYSTSYLCTSNGGAITSAQIGTSEQEKIIYFRANGTAGVTETLQAEVLSGGLANSGSLGLITRGAAEMWAQMDFPHNVISDACYPMSMISRNYYDNLVSMSQAQFPLGMPLAITGATTGQVRTYDSFANCQSESSGVDFGSSYLSFSDNSVQTNDRYVRFASALRGNSVTLRIVPPMFYDQANRYVHVSSDSSATQLRMEIFEKSLSVNRCYPLSIGPVSSGGATVPFSSTGIISLTPSAGITFYSDASCFGTLSGLSAIQGRYQSNLWFMLSNSGPGQSIAASISGLSGTANFAAAPALSATGCSTAVPAFGGICTFTVSGGYPPYSYQIGSCPATAVVNASGVMTTSGGSTGTCMVHIRDSTGTTTSRNVPIGI